MPAQRISYSSQYRSRFDFPQFKVKVGERARIILIEPDPMMEVSHFVKGSGSVACIGDYNTVINQGMDEKCPLCRVGQRGMDVPIGLAARRFCTHVLRYITRRDGIPIEPIAVETLLWRFGEDKFTQLLRKAEIYTDLRRYDITVECTDETYGKYQIEVLGNSVAAYLKDKDTAARILQQYKQERLIDFAPFLSRNLSEDMMLDIADRAFGLTPHRSNVPEDVESPDLGLLLDMTGGGQSSGNGHHSQQPDQQTLDDASDLMQNSTPVDTPAVDLDSLLNLDDSEQDKKE